MENEIPETGQYLLFVTGGARSGKSRYAQELALQYSNNPVYVATAKHYANDTEFTERINRHKADRDERWTSIEELLYISTIPLNKRVVVIDCVTLWLSNFFSLHQYNVSLALDAMKKEIDALKKIDAMMIIISNEIGMGVHAETEMGRMFTDLQGWANQYIASQANEVVLMVSGIPLTIKTKTAHGV